MSTTAVILALVGAIPAILKLILMWVERQERKGTDEKLQKLYKSVADGDTVAIRDILDEL